MISKPTAFCQKKKFLGKPEAANEAFEDCSFQQLRCAQIECLKLCLYITCTSWDCGNVSCGCLNWELQNPLSCYFALAFVIYMTHVLVVGFFFFFGTLSTPFYYYSRTSGTLFVLCVCHYPSHPQNARFIVACVCTL